LNGHSLEIKNTHKILGPTFDNRLTWKTHIDEVRSKCIKKKELAKMPGWNELGSRPRNVVGSARDDGSLGSGVQQCLRTGTARLKAELEKTIEEDCKSSRKCTLTDL
jgi:hypothetical protein